MKVFRDTIEIRTEENQRFLDVTKQIRDAVSRSSIQNGTIIINSLHTTVAIFVNEFKSALINDLGTVLQKLIPRRDGYLHDDPRHSDCDRGNAHAHLRASLIGPSESIPLVDGRLVLGTWQQVVLIDFDDRPRDRVVHVQIVS